MVHKLTREEQGWEKPTAPASKESMRSRIAELKAELETLEHRLAEVEDQERLEAIVRIRNLMRGFELSWDDILPKKKRRGRPRKTEAANDAQGAAQQLKLVE